MLDCAVKSIVVLILALCLGRGLIGMLLDVLGAAASGVASGIGRVGSVVGSMLVILLAVAMVVGVLVRGKDALGRFIRPSGRGRHGGDPNARFARRECVAGDTAAPRRPSGSPRRHVRPREEG